MLLCVSALARTAVLQIKLQNLYIFWRHSGERKQTCEALPANLFLEVINDDHVCIIFNVHFQADLPEFQLARERELKHSTIRVAATADPGKKYLFSFDMGSSQPLLPIFQRTNLNG